MKAFISYSHADKAMLEKLEIHLANLTRDQVLSSWTDKEINPGGLLDKEISENLTECELFIALLSPEYIASNYCFEKEFLIALEMAKQGKIIIVPIIIEPCDWLKTPLKDFKALPTDGKPISDWQNINTAFLNITQELRKLLESNAIKNNVVQSAITSSVSRNYRVKKDFDSIQMIEFKQNSFKEIIEMLKEFFLEAQTLDNVKQFVSKNTDVEFEGILVNRNKINTESKLKISIASDAANSNQFSIAKSDLKYTLEDNWNYFNSFELSYDEYEIFWVVKDNHFNNFETKHLDSKAIANKIWNELIEKVGLI